MPRTPRQMEKLLLRNGWIRTKKKSKSGHRYYLNPTTKQVVPIPFHSKDLPKGTERAILKEVGFTEKWRK